MVLDTLITYVFVTVTLSVIQLNIGWPWRCLHPFCLKTSLPAPSVWRCSPTPCLHHAATVSARPASPPIGTEEEEETPRSTSVPSARSPSASDRSSISTEPWRKSLSSSSRCLMLESEEEWKIPMHILIINIPWPCLHPQGQGRFRGASLPRWWPVFNICRHLGCHTIPSPFPRTFTLKAPVESNLNSPSRFWTSIMIHHHPTPLLAGTKPQRQTTLLLVFIQPRYFSLDYKTLFSF